MFMFNMYNNLIHLYTPQDIFIDIETLISQEDTIKTCKRIRSTFDSQEQEHSTKNRDMCILNKLPLFYYSMDQQVELYVSISGNGQEHSQKKNQNFSLYFYQKSHGRSQQIFVISILKRYIFIASIRLIEIIYGSP